MQTYYVATRVRWVLVQANDETRARELGQKDLYDLYEDDRERTGRDTTIEIHTVRLANDDEIELWNWHQAKVAEEMAQRARQNA